MIEVVADRLSPSERDRWRAIVTDSPLAARFSRADPAVRMVGAVLCGAAFLSSLDGAGHGSLVTVVRMLALSAITFSTASALESLRAGRSPWPNGRFVVGWGYVEVENGVLRAYPRSELTHEIRGSRFGLGRVRLRLRAGRWSTSMTIDPSEAERIVTSWAEQAELPPQPATGYREPPRTPELVNGKAPRWRPPRSFWRIALAIAVAPIALAFSMPTGIPMMSAASAAVPASPIAAPTSFDDYTSHFAVALRAEPDTSEVSVHLERCSLDEMTAGTIGSYLTLALERRRLGPADLGAIPFFAREPETPVRIWARCRWAVDPETGMFARVEARWGLTGSGAARIERRATVGVADVTGALASCAVGPLSPSTVAHTSLVLASHVVRQDIYRPRYPDGTSRTEQCLMERARSIAVRSAPSSS